MAISQIFKRSIEVYEHSEKPRVIEFSDNQGNNLPPIRLLYKNLHYASVRSDGAGDLFNFEGLELEEIRFPSTSEIMQSEEYKKRIESIKDLSLLDLQMRRAIEK